MVVVTPSRFSLEGLVACGIPRARIAVVPHGVRSRPLGDAASVHRARDAERGNRGWKSHFVLLHVGAATPNKNVATLIAAFRDALHTWSRVATKQIKPRGGSKAANKGRPLLVLKGLDGLYGSGSAIRRALDGAQLSAHEGPSLRGQEEVDVQIVGDPLSSLEMARLYAASDGYVSASMAEAFQLPLAEASAAGLPVIVPSGGAAEEVVDPASAVFVDAVLKPRATDKGFLIQPERSSLTAAMLRVLHDKELRERASARGPLWVANRLLLSASVDELLSVVTDPRYVGDASACS